MFVKSVRIILTLFVINGVTASVLITGGLRCDKYAEFGDFTHQVSLRDQYLNHQCGGALISDRWAVGTAYCSTYSIQLMAVGVFTLDEADIYVVDNIKIHEQFDQSTGLNDIALFRTNREIQLSQYAQPIPYLREDIVACGANLVAVGWSDSGDHGYSNMDLTYVNFTAIRNEECQTLIQDYGFTVNNSSICVTTENMSSAECLGNFCYNSLMGLPLSFSKDRILIGFLTLQRGCGYIPVVATRVYNYANWISQNTNIVGVDMM